VLSSILLKLSLISIYQSELSLPFKGSYRKGFLKMKENGEVDVYRDTPVRLLGYANEVGEAFRALVHRNVVRLSYAIAFGYVFADTNDKTKKVVPNDTKTKMLTGADVLIWQTLASVAIPGFTINRICALSAILLRRSPFKSAAQKWITTGVGLSSIPFIVKPIDHFVDYLMDNTYRRYISGRGS